MSEFSNSSWGGNMSEFSNSSWDGNILCQNLVTPAGMETCQNLVTPAGMCLCKERFKNHGGDLYCGEPFVQTPCLKDDFHVLYSLYSTVSIICWISEHKFQLHVC